MTFAVHEPTLLQSGDGAGAEYITAFMNHIGDTALATKLERTSGARTEFGADTRPDIHYT
eukprot:7567391-Pyramimonas_sp.AAC.1